MMRSTYEPPPHIADWTLPPGWAWGQEGLWGEYRHYQEIVDALGRSLSLVTAPDSNHTDWLHEEARALGHRNHPSIPVTYHYWLANSNGRGPGYLRRWITGETVRDRVRRAGPMEIPFLLQLMRSACSALAYLHDSGATHGALTSDTIWTTPTGRFWLLEWEWAVPRAALPPAVSPDLSGTTVPPEWCGGAWNPTPASDQWQLAAMCYTALTGEDPSSTNIPPIKWLRPECPESAATALDRALLPNPDERFPSVAAFLRAADRGFASTGSVFLAAPGGRQSQDESDEDRVRWAVGDDYEILSLLGTGTFGTVWRARDLALEREVALKVLHPQMARDADSVAAFWREAKLAAQLAHPSIIPIYDWDNRGGLSWYTMELAEEGSVASLVSRSGPRPVAEVAPQIEGVLDGLIAAHASGIVHRDLKPENILIDRYHRWRITDFGIANVGGEATDTAGTPAFAAPEQLLGEPQGVAVDLFSVAAIVAFALSGHPPFGEPNASVQVILAGQLGERADLSDFPAAIADWLRTGLRAEPQNRFTDAMTMRDEWRDAIRGTGPVDLVRRWWRLLSLGDR